MKFLKIWPSFLLSLFCLSSWAAARGFEVDLHAHVFFHEGLGYSFLGRFDGPLHAKSWSNRLGSKINEETLIRSHVKVIVVALYAHPLFKGSLKDQIRRQIASAENFVARHPEWLIAREPADLDSVIKSGRRALIFSIEGASGILESDEDLREFVDERGVRLVTLLHFLDDGYGGAALMPGIRGILSPVGWFLSFFSSPKDPDSPGLENPRGLGPRGMELSQKLVQKGIWIDLAHSSDQVQRDLIPLFEANHLPLLYTHTSLRKYLKAERGISQWQLKKASESLGVVGLIPSEDMLTGTEIHPELCSCPPCPDGGVPSWNSQIREAALVAPKLRLALGSDLNSPMKFLKPVCGNSPSPQGFWNYSQLWDLASVTQGDFLSVEQFRELWSRVRFHARAKTPPSPKDHPH